MRDQSAAPSQSVRATARPSEYLGQFFSIHGNERFHHHFNDSFAVGVDFGQRTVEKRDAGGYYHPVLGRDRYFVDVSVDYPKLSAEDRSQPIVWRVGKHFHRWYFEKGRDAIVRYRCVCEPETTLSVAEALTWYYVTWCGFKDPSDIPSTPWGPFDSADNALIVEVLKAEAIRRWGTDDFHTWAYGYPDPEGNQQ
jgi:hypothetical protein